MMPYHFTLFTSLYGPQHDDSNDCYVSNAFHSRVDALASRPPFIIGHYQTSKLRVRLFLLTPYLDLDKSRRLATMPSSSFNNSQNTIHDYLDITSHDLIPNHNIPHDLPETPESASTPRRRHKLTLIRPLPKVVVKDHPHLLAKALHQNIFPILLDASRASRFRPSCPTPMPGTV